MKPIKTVYISGLGAIGAAYAGKLYEMDPECVRVIVNQQRRDRYVSDGVRVNGRLYPFRYLLPEDTADPADLIIIAVKQHQLEQAIIDIKRFVRKDTIILSLLNGIVSEEIIGNSYGMDKLLYSFVVGTDEVREGTSIQFSSMGRIVFGEKENIEYSSKVIAVKDLFDKAGISYSIPENMMRELWWKFMMNVGINQTSAVLRAPYGVFQNIGEARELTAMASREVVLLSRKAGINLDDSDIDKYLRILDTLSPQGKTSMLQDIEAGRKTEVELFAGTVIELGNKYGIDTPVNQMLFRMIRTLEQAGSS